MSAGDKQLVEYGRFLRNAAPREFEGFYEAFAAHSEGATYAMVSVTDHREMLRAQGRAQQCMKFMQILEEIKNG